MRGLRRLWGRLTVWVTGKQDDPRLQAEIEAHLAMQTAEYIGAGLPPVEARRRAILKFGAVEAIRQEYRDQQGLPFFEALIKDVRYGMRRLRKTPVFTVSTVLTLALGIGASTSIFTLVYAVLLKSLAVANPAELLRLGKSAQCCYSSGYSQPPEFGIVSYDLYKYFRDGTHGFSELAAFSASEIGVGVRRKGKSEAAQSDMGELVSGDYFRMFGVRAYAGRALVPADDRPNAAPVAVMSYRLWQERYGSDLSVVGSVFELNGRPFTIVGVTPPRFTGDSLRSPPPDFFLPLAAERVDSDSSLDKPDTSWLQLIGRVRPGVKTESIQAEMRVQLKQWLRSHWADMSANDRAAFPSQTLFLEPGGAGITGMRDEYEHWLQVLMMVAGFVLLIVCANVASLMLVRGTEQRQQIALSMALGARPWELVRRALTESVLLSILGGVSGLFIAYAGTSLILRFVFPRLGEMGDVPIDASPSMAVLLFAFLVSVLTGIGFGIAPAWMATRVAPTEALRGANRATVRSGSLARKAFLILQAAIALILLSASGLLTRALQKLETQNFGFDQNRRTIVKFDPRLAGYRPEQLAPLYRHIEQATLIVPGVEAQALCGYSPLSGNNWGSDVWVQGHSAPGPGDDAQSGFDRVRVGYFAAIGTSVVAGRAFDDRDTAASQHVAIINETFARRFFGKENPLGKYFGRASSGGPGRYQVVGVVKDARYKTFDLDKPIDPFLFLPEAQHDFASGDGSKELDIGSHYMQNLVVLAKPGVTVSSSALRHAIASVDPNLAITSIQSFRQQVANVFRQQRLLARLTSFFGLLSLLLSSVGLYGVTAYNAGRRTNEIGIRMALGAGRTDAVALLLRESFVLIVVGLLIGLPLTFATGRFLGSQLYGLSPFDLGVTLIAMTTLASCGLAAALVPAFRTCLVSPSEALRAE